MVKSDTKSLWINVCNFSFDSLFLASAHPAHPSPVFSFLGNFQLPFEDQHNSSVCSFLDQRHQFPCSTYSFSPGPQCGLGSFLKILPILREVVRGEIRKQFEPPSDPPPHPIRQINHVLIFLYPFLLTSLPTLASLVSGEWSMRDCHFRPLEEEGHSYTMLVDHLMATLPPPTYTVKKL